MQSTTSVMTMNYTQTGQNRSKYPCGYCSTSNQCSMPLSSWFYTNADDKENICHRHLTRCKKHNSNVLIWAIKNGKKKLVECILDKSLNILFECLTLETFQGDTALIIASKYGLFDFVVMLLDKAMFLETIQQKSNFNYLQYINKESKRGKTALLEATRNNHKEVVMILLSHRASILCKTTIHNQTALDWAYRSLMDESLTNELLSAYKTEHNVNLLFALISQGKVDDIKKTLIGGEKYRSNHLNILRLELEQTRNENISQNDVDEKTNALKKEEKLLKEMKTQVHTQEATISLLIENLESHRTKREEMEAQIRSTFRGFSMVLKTSITPLHINEAFNLNDPLTEEMYISKAICLLFDQKPTLHVSHSEYVDYESTREELNHYWENFKVLVKGKDFCHKLLHLDMQNKNILQRLDKIDQILNMKGLLDYDTLYPSLLEDNINKVVNIEERRGLKVIAAIGKWIRTACANMKLGFEIARINDQENVTKTNLQKENSRLDLQKSKTNHQLSRLNILKQELKENIIQMNLVMKQKEEISRKIEVAKIMAFITPSGHTILSWACAVGNAEIVQLLLQKGATVGYGDDYNISSAKIIQATYRHYRWRKINYHLQPEFSKREIALKDLCKTIKRTMLLRRLSIRNPLCEAFFNGNSNVLETFRGEEIPMGPLCMPTLVAPLGTLPRPFQTEAKKRDATEKPNMFSFIECAYMGRDYFETAVWINGIGWRGNSDEADDKYNLTIQVAENLWVDLLGKSNSIRETKKYLKTTKDYEKKSMKWSNEMEQSIYNGSFEKMIDCAYCGVDINFETSKGVTPLMRAAMEDNIFPNNSKCTNPGREPVSAVCFLLDRLTNRPLIDYESKHGYTALTYACYHGRLQSVKELLERGAVINRKSTKTGRTALIIASMKGKKGIAQYLIEQGADINVKDVEGKDAFDLARDFSYVETMAVLENAKRGVILRANAGKDFHNIRYPCRWGCGCLDSEENLELHYSTCDWRFVPCQFCDVPDLHAKDKFEHENQSCELRLIECTMCAKYIAWNDLASHTRMKCPKRFVTCPQCLNAKIEASKFELHVTNFCEYRKILCRYSCGEVIAKKFMPIHERQKCQNRSIRCCQCNFSFQARNEIDHEKFCCPESEIDCEFCSERFKRKDERAHIQNCTKTIVHCKNERNGCGWHGPKLMLSKHIAVTCAFSFINPCPLGCKIMLRKMDIDSHVEDECSRRKILCIVCCRTILSAEKKSHLKFNCAMKIPRHLRETLSM